jgi:mono/diheme cytochrome c family protein
MKKSKKKKLQLRQQSLAAGTPQMAGAGTGLGSSVARGEFVEPYVDLPETAEPFANRVTLPVTFIALLGFLVFAADMYLMNHGGRFSALVYYPNTSVPRGGVETPFERGKVVFNQLGCAACHQPNGKGSPALGFPPLAESEWVTDPGVNRLIRIVLDGLTGPIEVKGQPFNNTMVPWRETLTSQQIADVLTYIRNDWGNSGSEVTVEQVDAIKTATADRANRNYTAPELLAIPAQ